MAKAQLAERLLVAVWQNNPEHFAGWCFTFEVSDLLPRIQSSEQKRVPERHGSGAA